MGALAVISERVEQLKQDKKSMHCITDSRLEEVVRVQTVALHTYPSSSAFHMTCLHFGLSLTISRYTSSTLCDLSSHIKQHQCGSSATSSVSNKRIGMENLGYLDEGDPRDRCLRELNN